MLKYKSIRFRLPLKAIRVANSVPIPMIVPARPKESAMTSFVVTVWLLVTFKLNLLNPGTANTYTLETLNLISTSSSMDDTFEGTRC